MIEEPLLKESNTSHETQDATAISRSSLRGKVKQQTRRLSLALNVGGNNAVGGLQGNIGGGGAAAAAGVGSNSSPFYGCSDFADSARAGILRCGREDDAGRLMTDTGTATGDTSATTSDCHGSKDSITLR